MIDINFKYKDLISHIQNKNPFGTGIPDIALILGSGLGDFADKVNTLHSISTADLQGYPPSTVEGHAGKIHFSEYLGKKLLIFQGRIHSYEGYKISECILPVWIASKLNCRNMFITNAAGGINFNYKPGDLMLASSFNGIAIKKELTALMGVSNIQSKDYFLNFPSDRLNNLLKEAAIKEQVELKEGVYWYTKGPGYETPAEIKMMRMFGADAVGMSTVHEAVFSASLGIATSSVSCITNYASGIYPEKLSHSHVQQAADMVKSKFERLVKRFISKLN